MYSSVDHSNGMFFVRMNSPTLAAIKGFTHGRVNFDLEAKTVQFARHPPLPLPDFAENVKEGAILSFGLLAPDGTERPQKRQVVILKRKDRQLFAPGVFRTASSKSKEDGWRTRVLRFRAYFTHPGIGIEDGPADDHIELPQWLQHSIERQRRFRNRLVKLCLDAREACCPINHGEFTRFMKETVLPAVDDFNNLPGHRKDKISTKKIRVAAPSIFVLRRFGAYLQHLESDGRPVPAGLALKIAAFAKDLKIDFTSINDFQRNLDAIVRQERYLEDLSLVKSEDDDGQMRIHKVYRRLTDPQEIEARRSELQLRDWEWKPVARGFKTMLKARKTLGLPFYEGWPRFSDETSTSWGIHYYFNNGGLDASLLSGKGVRGLQFEASIPPTLSGRKWKPTGRRAQRELSPAQISFHDALADEQFTFRFVVLRHPFPIPAGSLVKEWKLIHNRRGLWLCLVLEGRFAKPAMKGGKTGAVHVGWRKEGAELWPAMVFDATCDSRDAFHRVVIDTELPPEKSDKHTPFRINMGPSRKGRRSPYWIKESKPHLRAEQGAGAVQIQDTWKGLEWLGKWRDDRKDMFKSLLLNSLNPAPAELRNAGLRKLHKIGSSLSDPVLVNAYQAWAMEDKVIADLTTEFSARIASRLSDGYSQVAHDICRLLAAHGISTLAVQVPLLARLAKKTRTSKNVAEGVRLENSQANRQRIAPGQLLKKLTSAAESYGLNLVNVDSPHISRAHRGDPECNHVNAASAERLITCENCGTVYDQDENACRNMVAAVHVHPTSGKSTEKPQNDRGLLSKDSLLPSTS